jgi:hypothetical protein
MVDRPSKDAHPMLREPLCGDPQTEQLLFGKNLLGVFAWDDGCSGGQPEEA